MSDYKPITGELRKYATVAWDPWPDARDRLYQMCDRIDAIHANLEREYAELRERVAEMNEQSADMHGGGSNSITDELREWAVNHRAELDMGQLYPAMIEHIADRIDAEHERQLEVLYRDMSDAEYVELPKDANGEVWHVGDLVVGEVNPKNPKAIERMIWYGPDSGWQLETNTIIYPCPARPRHHHAPTVEDVLREMLDAWGELPSEATDEAIVAEYAKRLQLAGDVG